MPLNKVTVDLAMAAWPRGTAPARRSRQCNRGQWAAHNAASAQTCCNPHLPAGRRRLPPNPVAAALACEHEHHPPSAVLSAPAPPRREADRCDHDGRHGRVSFRCLAADATGGDGGQLDAIDTATRIGRWFIVLRPGATGRHGGRRSLLVYHGSRAHACVVRRDDAANRSQRRSLATALASNRESWGGGIDGRWPR